MEAKARALGHAIHPMLIPLLSTAAIFDVIYLFTDSRALAHASFYVIAAGVIGGLVAAVFGLVDWVAIPTGTCAKRIGAIHGLGNVVVVVMFAVSWLLRLPETDYRPGALAVALTIGGALISTVTGWLGGELVERLAVGVDDGAHPDAPSSLSGRPAHQP